MDSQDRPAAQPFIMLSHDVIDMHLTPYELSIYVVLKRYNNHDQQLAFPSLTTLGDAAGMSKPMVLKALKRLVELGLVTKIDRYEEGTRERAVNHYVIHDSARLGGKPYLPQVVNDVDHLVNDVDHCGKPYLPQVVNDVDSKKKDLKKNDLKKKRDVGDGMPSHKSIQPHIAVIDAWYDAMPAPPVERLYPRNVKVAKKILSAGYSAEQVGQLVRERYRDVWWQGKSISLEQVAKDLPVWVASKKDAVDNYVHAPVSSYSDQETVAAMQRLMLGREVSE